MQARWGYGYGKGWGFGGRGFSFPITINFGGDEPSYFDGGWAEASGNVTNDQIALGAELIVNGDFSAWTGDDPDSWDVVGEVGADPEVSEVGAGQGHGGAGNGLANLFNSATANQPRVQQLAIGVGNWHHITLDIDTVVSGTIGVGDLGDLYQSYGLVGSKILTARATTATFRMFTQTSGADITIDNASVKLQTLTSLFNTLKSQFGLADGFFIDVYINAVTADTQVGAIWNYDGSNNFGMTYMDGTDLVVNKNVGGTYTELASVTQAVTQDQILRIENPTGTNALSIKYNGVEKATPTIADAGIISNTGIALFSTEAANAISKVVIGEL